MMPKFLIGQVVATPGALEALTEGGQAPADFLCRHVQGDYGHLCADDRRLNDEAIVLGGRVLSAYRTSKNEELWIITEADRSSTCLLLPSEY